MKKIVTALMVILPLIFLIALFAITSVTSITADIPATGITITNKGENGILSFDIANYVAPVTEEDLGVEVLPYKAKNRKYSLAITDANTGEDTSIISLSEDGSFALNDVGMARLTYTSDDGGYTDSVIFNVDSSGILSYEPVIMDAMGNIYPLDKGTSTDYSVDLKVGNYTLKGAYYPETAINVQPKYASADNNIVKINEYNGGINAYFASKTTISMSVVDAYGKDVKKSIEVNVKKPSSTPATVNGKALSTTIANAPSVVAPLKTKSFTIYVDINGVTNTEDLSVTCVRFADVYKRNITETGGYALDVTLQEAVDSEQDVTVKVSANGADYYFKVAFTDYKFSVYAFGNTDGQSDIVLLDGSTTNLAVTCEPETNIEYVWSIDNEDIATIETKSDASYSIKALKSGETTLKINWQKVENTAVVASGEIVKKLVVSKPYTSLIFNESVANHGLGTQAIASHKYDADGNIVPYSYSATLYNASSSQEVVTSFEDVELTSSSSIAQIVTSDTGIQINIKGNGTVKITAKWKYAERFNAKEASFTFTAVDGVMVETYNQLVDAGKKGKQIVLANDIYLGENLFNVKDDGTKEAKYSSDEMRAKLLSFTTEINTTFDNQYYKNIYGDDYQAKVRYCYEFTNNVYGNGYMLNAEYITDMIGNTGTLHSYAVFRGPLNFVAANLSGTDVASVKGQDNISFLIRTKDITLDNIVLAGCDDEALYNTDSQLELSYLDYVGTTLEVMEDATIKNCRVKNGRTVVRIHGKYGIDLDSEVNVSQEKINVTLDGCRLQTAREFILKMGTNRLKRDFVSADSAGPSFYDGNGNEYKNYNSKACDNYINDTYFVDNYVLTDVTLKDSTLSTSGLFSVGIESHFAGGMLHSGGTYNLPGWYNLAGTSYPAILHLVGNVVLDDWKDIDSVDSSTLIDTNIQSDQQNLAFLKLNVGEMLKMVQTDSNYSSIVYNNGGKSYVHGGIVFYGGGKNYSILDTSEYTFEAFEQYNINISILSNSSDSVLGKQGDLLPLAAGSKDFRFVMLNANSSYLPNNK